MPRALSLFTSSIADSLVSYAATCTVYRFATSESRFRAGGRDESGRDESRRCGRTESRRAGGRRVVVSTRTLSATGTRRRVVSGRAVLAGGGARTTGATVSTPAQRAA